MHFFFVMAFCCFEEVFFLSLSFSNRCVSDGVTVHAHKSGCQQFPVCSHVSAYPPPSLSFFCTLSPWARAGRRDRQAQGPRGPGPVRGAEGDRPGAHRGVRRAHQGPPVVCHTHTHPTTPPLIPRSHLYLLQRSEAPEPRQQRRHLRGPQQRHLPHCPRRVHPRARSCGRHAGRPGPAAAHHLVRQPSELPEAAAALRAPLLHPARCRPSARSALVCTTAAASRTAARTAARTGRSGAKGACAKAGTPAARCTQDAQR